MKLQNKLLVILTLITVNICSSQIEKDTLVAFQYYKKADSLLTAKKFDESIALFEKALPIYEQAKAWVRVAGCYNKISSNLMRMNKFDELLLQTNKTLEFCNNKLEENHLENAQVFAFKGWYYEQKHDYNSALLNYHKSLNIREKRLPKIHKIIGKTYYSLGAIYKTTGKFDKAIEYFKRVLSIYSEIFEQTDQKIGDTYSWLGSIYSDLQKNDEALNYYKKALSVTIKNKGESSVRVAMIYMNLGITYRRIKQLDLAIDFYNKSLLIHKKKKNFKEVSKVYLNTGILYSHNGEYDKALKYIKRSLEIWETNYGNTFPVLFGLANMHMCYIYLANRDIEKGLRYINKALDIFRDTFGDSNSYVTSCYDMLGEIYIEKKKYDIALNYFNKSLKIKKRIYDKDRIDIVRTYNSFGLLYNQIDEYDKALEYYKKSIDFLKKSPEEDLNLFIDTNEFIAEIYFKLGAFDKSLNFYDEALQYNTKDVFASHNNNLDFKKYHILNRALTTLSGKAKIYLELYKRDNNISDLNKCIRIYKDLNEFVDYLGKLHQNYEDKVSLAEKSKEIYTHAIRACMIKYKITNETSWLGKMQYYSEKSKSNILKKLLSDHNAKKFLELPKELITLTDTLKSNKAYYQSRITSEQTKDSIDNAMVQKYEGKLFDVSGKQDSLIQLLEKKYPRYYKLKHDNNVISASGIQDKLDKNSTLLEFSLSDSITYAFTITKNKFTVKELQTPNLDEQIKAFREATISKDITSYKQLGNSLYNTLIRPIKNELVANELIIIPDGSLWHLNFDLLLTKGETTKTPSELPYLLKDYAITYANSATLYFNPFQETQQKERQQGVLAFSFSDSTNMVNTKNISLARLRGVTEDLPGTRKEIKAIADIIDGQYFFGEDSDEANFKKNASKYKILHLALHGDVDNERPQNSKLYFTKSKDTIEDSYLYGHELFALNIPSELTVLSACNTGTGKIAKGEGVMSLGHAFQYAGTKSLLLSSWEVPDETTPELMKYFYTNLKEGMSKSKALQQAKLQYLEQADIYKAAPFYWGGFYLVGDNAPIDFGVNSLWYWGIGLVVGLVFITIFLLYRKNKQIS